ncbi:MAG: histidinol-phosphatase, partial [Oscillospiraceae bacterium]
IEYLQLANTSTYDVLGHLTYPYRYIRQRGESYPIIDEALAEIMKAAIRQGKGIEINTSTPEFTLPLKKHLQLYKDLGGEIVSVGSDSHSPQRVGTGIKLGHQILKEVGFKYATYFEKRNPVFVKI